MKVINLENDKLSSSFSFFKFESAFTHKSSWTLKLDLIFQTLKQTFSLTDTVIW